MVVRSSSSGEEGDGNGSDEEKNENDASSSNNSSDVSMSFAEELRKRGIKGLGQPLKSFRDNPQPFIQQTWDKKYLDKLGVLDVPKKD